MRPPRSRLIGGCGDLCCPGRATRRSRASLPQVRLKYFVGRLVDGNPVMRLERSEHARALMDERTISVSFEPIDRLVETVRMMRVLTVHRSKCAPKHSSEMAMSAASEAGQPSSC